MARATKEMDVRYPVVVDNGYAFWQAFDNWPGRCTSLRKAGTEIEQGLMIIEPHGV